MLNRQDTSGRSVVDAAWNGCSMEWMQRRVVISIHPQVEQSFGHVECHNLSPILSTQIKSIDLEGDMSHKAICYVSHVAFYVKRTTCRYTVCIELYSSVIYSENKTT